MAPFIPFLLGILGLAAAYQVFRMVLQYPPGTGRVVEIADEIHKGAMTFMRREYTILAVFVVVVAFLILISDLGARTMLAFIVGALCSAGAGWFGMYTATHANVRTTTAAHTKGASEAMSAAFFGGSIMGITVAATGLLGLGFLYLLFGGDPATARVIHGFGMGASSVALFARVGGGIFTKSADVGADLVGKLEAGIPEDDPRNPGVIADNVGDNVGDLAGMGSDLFESYVGSMIATMALGVALANSELAQGASQVFVSKFILLPLVIAGAGLLASIIGTLFVKASKGARLHTALNRGTYISTVLTILAMFVAVGWFLPGEGESWTTYLGFFWGSAAGLVAGVAIGKITEYYTSDHYKPVKGIAEASQTGTATN